jgi:hypothetical protein
MTPQSFGLPDRAAPSTVPNQPRPTRVVADLWPRPEMVSRLSSHSEVGEVNFVLQGDWEEPYTGFWGRI